MLIPAEGPSGGLADGKNRVEVAHQQCVVMRGLAVPDDQTVSGLAAHVYQLCDPAQGIKAAFEPPGYRRDAAGIALPAVHIDQQFQLPQELLHVDVDHNVLLSVQYTPDKGCGESAAWHFPRSLV